MSRAVESRKAGTLEALETLTTLPKDFDETNACAEIKVHPSGCFLYVSTRGHDSSAGFALDGEMTALDLTPTEKTPRSFDIDASGQFLYAAGESSGKLATDHINETTGALNLAKTTDVGKTPWWVLAVEMRKKLAPIVFLRLTCVVSIYRPVATVPSTPVGDVDFSRVDQTLHNLGNGTVRPEPCLRRARAKQSPEANRLFSVFSPLPFFGRDEIETSIEPADRSLSGGREKSSVLLGQRWTSED